MTAALFSEVAPFARAGSKVAPGAWDRLAGRRFYSTCSWLTFCDNEPGALSGAATCYSEGKLVAAVPVAELISPSMPLYRWNDLLSSQGLPALPSRGLLVGPRQGYQTHLLALEEELPGTLVAKLVEEIRRVHALFGEAHERACVAMYVTTRDAVALRRAGVSALPVLLGADAWLQVPPGGWPAWLESMTSKNRLKKVKKEVRRFRQAGYEINHMFLSQCYEKLAVAAASTQSKYGNSGNPDDYLPALRRYVERMGAVAKVAVCSQQGGTPVGFCIYFIWGDTIFLRWCGFDHRRLISGAAEYFNLLYYGQIKLAEELGVRWIHAGIKSTEAKARRGAQLRPLWLVDLVEDSILAQVPDRVRQHNERGYRRLAEDSQTAEALVDLDSWQIFL